MPRTTDRTVISLQWALVGVLGEFVRLKSNEWRVWCDGGGGTRLICGSGTIFLSQYAYA